MGYIIDMVAEHESTHHIYIAINTFDKWQSF